ncbi:MAG: TrmH family RNA methyltransferase [Nitrososphaerota archaeon]
MDITKLSVAMMAPKYPINVGYVARVMKNYGLSDLYLVDSKKFGSAALRYASHGKDILSNAKYVTFDELYQVFNTVIGTTAITSRSYVRKSVSSYNLSTLHVNAKNSVILLGRDTTGLTTKELAKCDIVLHIPTGTLYKTLNISHALAILLYELRRSNLKKSSMFDRRLVDVLLSYMDKLATKANMRQNKKYRSLAIIRRMIYQSDINEDQIVSLIGFFRKILIMK